MFLDAISQNLNFSKPRRHEFENAMQKALKSTKERFRRQLKRSRCSENDDDEEEEEIKEPFLRRAKIVTEHKNDVEHNQSINYSDNTYKYTYSDNADTQQIENKEDYLSDY